MRLRRFMNSLLYFVIELTAKESNAKEKIQGLGVSLSYF